jgi:hypothetical protein
MTDKIRKACERYGSALAIPNSSMPLSTNGCDSSSVSTLLSCPSNSLASSSTTPYVQQQQVHNQNSYIFDLQTMNSIVSNKTNSDPFDFDTTFNDCTFNFGNKYDGFSSITLHNNHINDTSKQIMMPNTNQLDAMTFDILLRLVEQNRFNPTQDS